MPVNNDLISRSALLKKAVVPFPGAFSSMISSWDVATAPAVDAVEVVRCKDCENCVTHRKKDGTVYFYKCDFFDVEIEGNDFRSNGERRADE